MKNYGFKKLSGKLFCQRTQCRKSDNFSGPQIAEKRHIFSTRWRAGEAVTSPALRCRKSVVFHLNTGQMSFSVSKHTKVTTSMGPEGVQGATGKPPGRARRRETLAKQKRIFPKILQSKRPRRSPGGKAGVAARKVAFSFGKGNPPTADWLAAQGAGNQPRGCACPPFSTETSGGTPRRLRLRNERKAPWSPPQRRNPLQNQRKESPFPAFRKKSISCERFRPPAGGRGTFHHWKVPKGCRGRLTKTSYIAAPGPPVAKQGLRR